MYTLQLRIFITLRLCGTTNYMICVQAVNPVVIKAIERELDIR
jgi:hypothetical protein